MPRVSATERRSTLEALVTTSTPATPRQQPTDWYSDYRMLTPEVAALLRDARLVLGLTVREAARRASISSGYLSRLERGLRAPRIDVATRLAVVLDLGPGERERLLREAVGSTYR